MTAWSRHSIHWYENVSSMQSQPSFDALICEFDWEFKQHDTHTKIHFKHQSDSPNLNRIITSKEKWKDGQVLFYWDPDCQRPTSHQTVRDLVSTAQASVLRRLLQMEFSKRMVSVRKWMHYSCKGGRDLQFFDDLPCFASCNWSCNQHLWLLCAFEWKQIQLASRINYTRVINIAHAHLQFVKAYFDIFHVGNGGISSQPMIVWHTHQTGDHVLPQMLRLVIIRRANLAGFRRIVEDSNGSSLKGPILEWQIRSFFQKELAETACNQTFLLSDPVRCTQAFSS